MLYFFVSRFEKLFCFRLGFMGRLMPKQSTTDLTDEELSSLLFGYRFFCKDLRGRCVDIPGVYSSRESALSALSSMLYLDALPKLSLVVLQRFGERPEVIYHA